MTHARHHKSAFASALLEVLATVTHSACRRHTLFGDELPHGLFWDVAAFPRFGIFAPNELYQFRRVNCCDVVVRIVFDARSLAQIKHDAAIFAAAERDIVALGRFMEAQTVHGNFHLVHLAKEC